MNRWNTSLPSAQLIIYWTLLPKNSVWGRWIWGRVCRLLLIWERKHVFPRLQKIRCFRNEDRKARSKNPEKGRILLQQGRLNLQNACAELAWAEIVKQKFQISTFGGNLSRLFCLISPASWSTKTALVCFCGVFVQEFFVVEDLVLVSWTSKSFGYLEIFVFKTWVHCLTFKSLHLVSSDNYVCDI